MLPPINQDTPGIIKPLATYTDNPTTSADFSFAGERGIALVLTVTEVASGKAITPSVQFKDPITGTYVTVASFGAISGADTQWYLIGRGITETIANAKVEVQGVGIPYNGRWRLSVAQSGSASYSCAEYPIY